MNARRRRQLDLAVIVKKKSPFRGGSPNAAVCTSFINLQSIKPM
jgi:hypothetical protein